MKPLYLYYYGERLKQVAAQSGLFRHKQPVMEYFANVGCLAEWKNTEGDRFNAMDSLS